MKTFFKAFLLLLIVVGFTSCQSDDVFTDDTSSIPKNELRLSLKDLNYEMSIPVWTYYYYENSSNSDHYSGIVRPNPEQNGTIMKIKNLDYVYTYVQDFNILPFMPTLNEAVTNTKLLRRYYSPSGKRHRLSTAKGVITDVFYHDYILEETLGHVFASQIPGTIPLKESLVINQKEYNYYVLDRAKEWGDKYMPGGLLDLGIIGYVFPGKRSEFEDRKAQVITFDYNKSYPTYIPLEATSLDLSITLSIEEELKPGKKVFKELIYNNILTKGGEIWEIPLAGAYRVQNIEIVMGFKNSYSQMTYYKENIALNVANYYPKFRLWNLNGSKTFIEGEMKIFDNQIVVTGFAMNLFVGI